MMDKQRIARWRRIREIDLAGKIADQARAADKSEGMLGVIAQLQKEDR